MDLTAEFTTFHDQVTSKLVQTTRAVGKISLEDLRFHRSSDKGVAQSLDEQSARLLSLTSSLLKVTTAGTDVKAPVLRDEESVEDNWRSVVDVIDNLLEKADACLDEFTGVIKKLGPAPQEQHVAPTKRVSPSKFLSIYDNAASKIPKPQLEFERPPDNADASPFCPLLKTKPHAFISLEESLQLINSGSPPPFYRNPYEKEIRGFKFSPSIYNVSAPIIYQPFETTTATFVDTPEGINTMLEELKSATEIAIDLEHHDVHSYHGIVSLMQISTRDKDWVIDTLKPWREDLQRLNEVFVDPKILKVFHGASMDIIWLQRDLGLYVVGMFDTYHAAVALAFPKRSLKFLLQEFVKLKADKRYQVADWRIRPLPSDMFDYARSDTHYLLYIYDHLRNQLVQRSTPEQRLVDFVHEQSKAEALQRYERPVYDAESGQGPGGWYDFLTRSQLNLSKEQFSVFKAVHRWRDQMARDEDEGVQWILSRIMLIRIAQTMPLDRATLFRTVSPITPIVRDRADDLLSVIKAARIEGASGPEWRDIVKLTRATVDGPQTSSTVVPERTRLKQGPLATPEESITQLHAASRLEVSQFWGLMLPHRQKSAPAEYSAAACAEALRLSLPLPPVLMTVSEVPEKSTNSGTNKPDSFPQPAASMAASKELNRDEIFTVKEIGGKRKRKNMDLEDSVSSAPPTASSSVNGPGFDANALGQSVKEPFRESVNGEISTVAQRQGGPDQGMIPFDYAAAASVLHANPDHQSPSQQSKKPFNPYIRALNAPQGMPKAKRDSGGRLFTFRK